MSEQSTELRALNVRIAMLLHGADVNVVPCYSTDPLAALEVVEWLSERRLYIEITRYTSRLGQSPIWECCVWPEETDWQDTGLVEQADSFAEAIAWAADRARAKLLAKEQTG